MKNRKQMDNKIVDGAFSVDLSFIYWSFVNFIKEAKTETKVSMSTHEDNI